VNPHDTLDDPLQSARIILGHVTEGVRLARQYRLPNRIREFIAEHHGTTRVAYFYGQAQKRAENASEPVDDGPFTYPGPRPRARRPQSKEDIQETVDHIFESRLRSGQLDESNLTLNDLRLLRDTFLTALQGMFHPRIAYPGTPSQLQGLPSDSDATPPERDSQKTAETDANAAVPEDNGVETPDKAKKPATPAPKPVTDGVVSGGDGSQTAEEQQPMVET